ncbi:hypothetical protein [Moorena producens]|uniref:hypothetical protein n=1 Tax=Moorena producens TaxID=1155739 RepID=UPI003C79366A
MRIFVLFSLLPTPYSLLPTPYSLLPTPYSLFPLVYTQYSFRQSKLTGYHNRYQIA